MSNLKTCGFCILIRDLMRRALCIGPRRGSSESYYRELGDQDTLKIDGSQSSVDSIEIRITLHRRASDADRQAADQRPHGSRDQEPPASRGQGSPEPVDLRVSVEISIEQVSPDVPQELRTQEIASGPRNTGRFHSMHRRRRRRLITRSFSTHEGLLDDLFIGQVQCVLDRSSSWDFSAFILDNVAGGHGLSMLCVHLFEVYGLISHFRLDPVKVWKLSRLFEENYHDSNPYHNSVHAADVTQAMHCFLQQERILEYMQPIDLLAGLLAAIAHDLDHPGVNQPFLAATSNHLVDLYENQSVLENHHWRMAVSCLVESSLMDDIPEIREQLQQKIRLLILATDITRQQDYLGQFKVYLETGSLDLTRAEHRLLVLQIALKCADISNPCRSWEISKTWSLKVCEEFFRQGDVERRLNLPVTPLCDRNTTTVPTIQSGFFMYVVTPLITEWHRFLQSDLSEQMLKNLVNNHKRWDSYAKETQEVVVQPTVVTEEEQESANLSGSSEMLLPRRSSLNPARPASLREQLRRFSVPLNVFQDTRPRNREPVLQEVAGALVSNDISDDEDDRLGRVMSSENMHPDSSITSITTPMQAQRISVLYDRHWRLVKQPTFPPLEGGMSRAHSLIPCASSHDDCTYARDVKSESGVVIEGNTDDSRRSENRVGNQLRDNLTSIPLNLGRRRKSMPARAEPMSRERRLRELRELLPALIARSLSPRTGFGLHVRRGSAPVSGSVERPTTPASAGRVGRAFQFSPRHALPRRSSLPVEVSLQVESPNSSE